MPSQAELRGMANSRFSSQMTRGASPGGNVILCQLTRVARAIPSPTRKFSVLTRTSVVQLIDASGAYAQHYHGVSHLLSVRLGNLSLLPVIRVVPTPGRITCRRHTVLRG